MCCCWQPARNIQGWGPWKQSAVRSADWRRQRASKIKPYGAIRSRAKVPSTLPPLRDVKQDQMEWVLVSTCSQGEVAK